MAKFSHIVPTDAISPYRVKTICGKFVDGMNLPAMYRDGGKYQHPLCPKCAALRVIAESTLTEDAR